MKDFGVEVNKEINKLMQFAYNLNFADEVFGSKFKDLYNKEDLFPRGLPKGFDYPSKKNKNGVVFWRSAIRNHDTSDLYRVIIVIPGEHTPDGFKHNSLAIKFSAWENHGVFNELWCEDLRFNQKTAYFNESEFSEVPDSETAHSFTCGMAALGFKSEHVDAMLNGMMTAEQCFEAVAPKEIVHLRDLHYMGKRYIFDGNVAIKGDFKKLDDFPFPFDGPAILDCSKINTYGVNFGLNERRHKLININSNPNSIKYADITNAEIDEVIDCSAVDVQGTEFGHNVVINTDKHKGSFRKTDFSLATDEFGNKIYINAGYKASQPTGDGMPAVYANAGNAQSVLSAIQNGAAGIGLIRTEYMFFDENKQPSFIPLFITPYEKRKSDNDGYITEYDKKWEQFSYSQQQQAREILSAAGGRKVTFRLIDAKLNDFLTTEQRQQYAADFEEAPMRGAELLIKNEEVVSAQTGGIFLAAADLGVPVDILVPMITDAQQFVLLRKQIDRAAARYEIENYRVGAMIETKSIAYDIDQLIRTGETECPDVYMDNIYHKGADFISFGTNDLTEDVTGLPRQLGEGAFETLTKEVKEVIKESVNRARVVNPNIEIGFCGNHANFPQNFDFFKEVKANYISCRPDFVPLTKNIFENRQGSSTGSILSNTYTP